MISLFLSWNSCVQDGMLATFTVSYFDSFPQNYDEWYFGIDFFGFFQNSIGDVYPDPNKRDFLAAFAFALCPKCQKQQSTNEWIERP